MLSISLVRMHHIRSMSKFRRLKQFAVNANVSGLAKTGRPGVLVFDGTLDDIKRFLENARDFHHVQTKPLESNRVVNGKLGLHTVDSMSELVQRLDSIGQKEWFRTQLGMAKPPHPD